MAIHNVDAKTLKQWLEEKEVTLIDVREPDEYQAGHISEATLIPLATITNNILPSFAGKKLVVHCRLGKRGLKACEMLLAENPRLEVYNLEGGIMAWAEAGHAVMPKV